MTDPAPGPSRTPLPPLPSLVSNPKLAPVPLNPSRAPSASLTAPAPYYPPPPTSFSATATARAHRPPMSEPAGAGKTVAVHKYGLTVSQSQASAAAAEWEIAYEREQEERWAAKVKGDLEGWRGGKGVKRSDYSRQALPTQSYFHQPITGDINYHLPKEVVRVERDWSDGEVCLFETAFPMELDDRITPAQFISLINTLNTHLVAAYSIRGAVLDNVIAIATWWTSLLWRQSTFERELRRVEEAIKTANEKTFNPAGLNVLSPRDVALQFLEIE